MYVIRIICYKWAQFIFVYILKHFSFYTEVGNLFNNGSFKNQIKSHMLPTVQSDIYLTKERNVEMTFLHKKII